MNLIRVMPAEGEKAAFQLTTLRRVVFFEEMEGW
jgi:hypothetical protein